MKRCVSIFFFMLSMLTLQSQNYNACGEAYGLWAYDTVFVQCDVVIPSGQTLQIAPGTLIQFQGHYALHVQGSLKALGEVNDSIIFTVADTTGFGNIHSSDGGWNGIRLEDTPEINDSSQFAYCRLSFGKAVGDSANCYGGAMRIKRFNKISIRNSHIHNNFSFYSGAGIYAFKSNLVIENSTISGNYSGNDGMIYGYGGGLCFVSSDPVVRKNLFYGNVSTGVGGAASFEYSKPILLDCIVRDNYSALGGGLCFLRSQPDKPVANLLIINNEAKFFGGGIANLTATTVMSNATITGNLAPMGGGYYCNEYAHAKLFNSILWGNIAYDTLGSQVWIWDVNSIPGFYHCVIEGGVPWFGGSTFQGEYVANVETDPLFADAANADFSLLPGSPAINNGLNDIGFFALPENDLSGHSRMMYQTVDMGAFEYQGFVKTDETLQAISPPMIYPNPVQNNSLIRFISNESGICSIKLVNTEGRVLQSCNIPLIKGENSIELQRIFRLATLKQGIYILEISNRTESWVQKMML